MDKKQKFNNNNLWFKHLFFFFYSEVASKPASDASEAR